MTDQELQIDEAKFSIMGVEFPDIAIFRAAKGAIGSSIIEGYHPTQESIERIKSRFLQRRSLV